VEVLPIGLANRAARHHVLGLPRAVKPNCPTSDQFGFLVECAFELDA
jgi:hypothetical protein